MNISLTTNTTGIYWFAIYQNGGDFRLGLTAPGNVVSENFSMTRLKQAPGYTGYQTKIIPGTIISMPTDVGSATYQVNSDRLVWGLIGA